MSDRLVGLREAGPRLGVSAKTLQRKCTQGTCPVPARLTAAGWMLRDSDITRYIEALFADATDGAQAATR